MADEVTDVNQAEITTDIFADEAEKTAPEAPSAEGTKTEAPAKVEGEPAPTEEAKPAEEPTAPEPKEGEAPPEGTPTEEPKPRTAEARKEQLNNEIRDLVAKRNQARSEIEAINAKTYQAATPEELIEQGQDPAIARVMALEQRQQIAEYNAQVTDLNANLSVESLQVLNDFPMFNPDAPEYDAALAQRAATVYQKVAGIETDPQTGLIVSANALPYEIYKAFAETHTASVQSGQVNGQRAAERMLAATDTPPSSAPKTAKLDPLMELWKD